MGEDEGRKENGLTRQSPCSYPALLSNDSRDATCSLTATIPAQTSHTLGIFRIRVFVETGSDRQ
jgi:hypothetical protein